MANLGENLWNLALQPLKTFYLCYHNLYGHQTWQSGDIPWGAPYHDVISSFNHVVFWIHTIYLIFYILSSILLYILYILYTYTCISYYLTYFIYLKFEFRQNWISSCSVVVERNRRFSNDYSKLAKLVSFFMKQAKLLVSLDEKWQKKHMVNFSQENTLNSTVHDNEMNTSLPGTIDNYVCRSFQGNIIIDKETP